MDQIQSAIRVAAAYVAGMVIMQLGMLVGIEFPPEATSLLADALQGLFGVLYYVAVRTIAKFIPAAEWLLIIPKSPVLVKAKHQAVATRNVRHLR